MSFLRTLGRQIWAYTGGVLFAAIIATLLDNFLGPSVHGWPRYQLGRFPLAEIPRSIAATASLSFPFILVPFFLFRALVAMNAEALSGRVGPVAAAVAGIVPAVLTALAVNGLFAGILNLDAYSLSLTALGGAAGGLAYWWLGGFARADRP